MRKKGRPRRIWKDEIVNYTDERREITFGRKNQGRPLSREVAIICKIPNIVSTIR